MLSGDKDSTICGMTAGPPPPFSLARGALPAISHFSRSPAYTQAARVMPLPPRDLSAVHLSLNPALVEVHAVNPLSRYAPAVALFRLYKLGFDGVPLAGALDMSSWMTLACLDDMSGDYAIACAVMAWHQSGGDAHVVNQAFVHAASPYVVPLLVPLPPPGLVPMPPPRKMSIGKPAKQHVPPPPPPPKQRRPPPPAPPPSPATKMSCGSLHISVLRVICALVREFKGRVDMPAFDANTARLQRLPTALACKALREFAGELRGAEAGVDAPALLRGVLGKYE